LLFPDIFERPVIAKFDQRQGKFRWRRDLAQGGRPEAGSDFRVGCLSARGAATGQDLARMEELLTQRVMGMALGYEDGQRRRTSGMRSGAQLLVGRDPIDGEIWPRSPRCRVLKMPGSPGTVAP